jgi:predicted Fe-Mo cluster-binding NifX family protein
MKVCFPVQNDQGIESRVYNHFGTAPVFIVFDTDTKNISAITNNDQHHAHGACNPIKALGDHMVDAIVVGGIGGGALSRLNQLGIRVFRSEAANIKDNIAMLQSQQLSEYTPQQTCSGHSHGGGCAH